MEPLLGDEINAAPLSADVAHEVDGFVDIALTDALLRFELGQFDFCYLLAIIQLTHKGIFFFLAETALEEPFYGMAALLGDMVEVGAALADFDIEIIELLVGLANQYLSVELQDGLGGLHTVQEVSEGVMYLLGFHGLRNAAAA